MFRLRGFVLLLLFAGKNFRKRLRKKFLLPCERCEADVYRPVHRDIPNLS